MNMLFQHNSFNQEVLLSRNEAASYLGVKPRTLDSWATTKRCHLPRVKIGRLVKYRLKDLDNFIASRVEV